MAHPQRIKSHFRWGVVLLVLGALALTGLAPARRAYEQRQQLDAERDKLQELVAENEALEFRLQRLQDPAYVEKLVREELGLARPGDRVFVLPDRGESIELTGAERDAEPEEAGAMDWIVDRYDWIRSFF